MPWPAWAGPTATRRCSAATSLCGLFDLDAVGRSAAVFDIAKLN